MQITFPIVNRQMGILQHFSNESMFPTLTQLPTIIINIILCKLVICVYLFKDLLDQGGEHTFILINSVNLFYIL